MRGDLVTPAAAGGFALALKADAPGLAAGEEAEASSRLDGEFGYGMAVFGGGFTGTPNVGFGWVGAVGPG